MPSLILFPIYKSAPQQTISAVFSNDLRTWVVALGERGFLFSNTELGTIQTKARHQWPMIGTRMAFNMGLCEERGIPVKGRGIPVKESMQENYEIKWSDLDYAF